MDHRLPLRSHNNAITVVVVIIIHVVVATTTTTTTYFLKDVHMVAGGYQWACLPACLPSLKRVLILCPILDNSHIYISIFTLLCGGRVCKSMLEYERNVTSSYV